MPWPLEHGLKFCENLLPLMLQRARCKLRQRCRWLLKQSLWGMLTMLQVQTARNVLLLLWAVSDQRLMHLHAGWF